MSETPAIILVMLAVLSFTAGFGVSLSTRPNKMAETLVIGLVLPIVFSILALLAAQHVQLD